ncbi:unnamed protein product [Tilletia controversa]|uniref:SET domain-containing protein n=3 Tax=Tilletia TaxID=13289 RepID=A0A8X7T0A0_9BASI|nr:hypothetical protein CF336_g29 [Tilletia laevis]KAE8205952.1 hypothetical protein CF328_g180 [Tilletia controversa]KAE8265655.1 hypothetical protein A4X03_0g121 [Tilletia caries]KAE8208992.1 hypothetical protein CF335_g31 [Tilletia laevis]KAE8255662.1 hypothetical protein A4X06_0g312 [Tilletia controversa]
MLSSSWPASGSKPSSFTPDPAEIKETKRPKKKLKFSSKEVLDLCASRRGITRFPDLVARQSMKLEAEGAFLNEENRKWAAEAYRAYVQEHENSNAEFIITNTVDFEPHPPLTFCWTNDYVLGTSSTSLGAFKPHGCDCEDDECDPRTCSCLKKARDIDPDTWDELHDFAYDEDGNLNSNIANNTVIWECNDDCGCSDTCRNRNVQFGRKYGIELFKTHNGRGWGLKATERIPNRAFVLCYTGELLDGSGPVIKERGDVYDDVGMSYLLHLDSWHVKIETLYKPYNEARKRQGQDPLIYNTDEMKRKSARWRGACKDPMVTVDAAFWGNISRYINHSCEPNLIIFPVHFGPQAGYIIRPYFVFFSTRVIEEGEELTFPYSNIDDDEEESQLSESYGGSQSQNEPEDDKVEQSASQFPRSLSTKGYRSKAQRKLLQSAEDDDELNEIGAQKCLCGAKTCKGKFWR